jgi:regulator of replication initiation timing
MDKKEAILMDKWAKLLKDLKEVYTEIYDLERKRVEINKVINLKKQRLNALLNYLRLEEPNEIQHKSKKMQLLRSKLRM